jgi:hypothetical protein
MKVNQFVASTFLADGMVMGSVSIPIGNRGLLSHSSASRSELGIKEKAKPVAKA